MSLANFMLDHTGTLHTNPSLYGTHTIFSSIWPQDIVQRLVFHKHTRQTQKLNVSRVSLKCRKASTDLGPLDRSILNLSIVGWSNGPR
jgi:hypothetical protein